jgi:hypothetical protein
MGTTRRPLDVAGTDGSSRNLFSCLCGEVILSNSLSRCLWRTSLCIRLLRCNRLPGDHRGRGSRHTVAFILFQKELAETLPK